MSSMSRTPPEAMIGAPASASKAARPSTSGPASRPSRAMSVTISAAAPAATTSGDHVHQVPARTLGPAAHLDLAGPVIEADRYLAGPTGRHLGYQRGSLDGGGADAPPGPRRCRATRRRRPRRGPRRRFGSALRRGRPRRCAATTGRLAGSPVRAASRSTTWIHLAPAAAKVRATATGSSP